MTCFSHIPALLNVQYSAELNSDLWSPNWIQDLRKRLLLSNSTMLLTMHEFSIYRHIAALLSWDHLWLFLVRNLSLVLKYVNSSHLKLLCTVLPKKCKPFYPDKKLVFLVASLFLISTCFWPHARLLSLSYCSSYLILEICVHIPSPFTRK